MRLRALWLSTVLAALCGPASAWASAVAAGMGAAGRSPVSYPAVGAAFGGELKTAIGSVLAGREGAGDFGVSVLGRLAPAPLPDGAGKRPLDFTVYGPIVEQLEGLDIGEKEFSAMPALERREVLLMAVDAAREAVVSDAYAAINEVALNLDLSRPGQEAVLEAGLRRLERLQMFFTPYLPEYSQDSPKDHIQNQIAKYRLAAAGKLKERRERVLAAADETASALRAPALAVTSHFERDAKGFDPSNWGDLETELGKLGDWIASGRPLSGEQGNIKFLIGPLRGLGEIKFRLGGARTHRIFFRYLPESGEIVLIRVIAREALNNEARRAALLEPWMDDGRLAADKKAPDPEAVPLMKRLGPGDLDFSLK